MVILLLYFCPQFFVGMYFTSKTFELDEPMQWPARRTQRVDAFRDGGIFDQRRRMLRLDPRIDNQRPRAAPVLVANALTDAMNVGRRVRTGERRPQEIAD